jgi:hypothetical protein
MLVWMIVGVQNKIAQEVDVERREERNGRVVCLDAYYKHV